MHRNHLGREVNTSGVRQAHVQQKPHIHQHLYGDCLGQWRRLGGGREKGWGLSGGTQCGRSTNAAERVCGNLYESQSLDRNEPHEPAQAPHSAEVIQLGYLVTTTSK